MAPATIRPKVPWVQSFRVSHTSVKASPPVPANEGSEIINAIKPSAPMVIRRKV
ncbi:Uncharacterised protein [Vibrio cholerae]|nr:Uncharacterised protein [Vibrio cholerae]